MRCPKGRPMAGVTRSARLTGFRGSLPAFGTSSKAARTGALQFASAPGVRHGIAFAYRACCPSLTLDPYMDIRAASVADRRLAVERIRQENEDHFGDLARQAVQKLLTPALPHPWMYVYELTQNALDAGARRIYWRVDGDGVLFQHDGEDGLDESDVRGIASLGASTKGLGAVGFMGIGFKSVFARFREAQVSGFGWRFGFDVNVRRGPLRSTVPEWFDTLCPHWDDDAPNPYESYTTAFRLRRPTDPALSVEKDLEHLASVEDPTPLAVLALRGLTEVRVGDKVWELSVDDGIVSIRRSGRPGLWRWKTFVSRNRPDDAAMRQFLGVRQSLQDQIDARGRRVKRSVVGLLPFDEDGLPRPPARGRVYSTLPTQARIPFGFHLQADWLVDIDRQSLRQVEGSPWQEAIVRQVPAVPLAWVPENSCHRLPGNGIRTRRGSICKGVFGNVNL